MRHARERETERDIERVCSRKEVDGNMMINSKLIVLMRSTFDGLTIEWMRKIKDSP